MNVLWLAHAIPYPPKPGFLTRSYHLLRALARRQNVDPIAFIQEPWVKTLFPGLQEGIEESRHALGDFCRSVTFLPIIHLRPRWGKQITALRALSTGSTYSTSWLVSESARSAIARQLQINSYDLAHFDTIGLAPYRAVSGRIPATLTHHNIESHRSNAAPTTHAASWLAGISARGRQAAGNRGAHRRAVRGAYHLLRSRQPETSRNCSRRKHRSLATPERPRSTGNHGYRRQQSTRLLGAAGTFITRCRDTWAPAGRSALDRLGGDLRLSDPRRRRYRTQDPRCVRDGEVCGSPPDRVRGY